MPSDPHADAVSFVEIFDAELAYVIRSLQRLGVAEADVDDVAQDVFLLVHAELARYDTTRPIRPWLFAFCARLAANHRRLARHRLEVRDPSAVERIDASGDPQADLERVEARSLLIAALHDVPYDRRTVLVMHDIDACAAPVIADALSIPLNTVYSRLRVARKELEAALARRRERSA